MANQTAATALCACSFGAMPLPLQVSSQQTVMACNLLAATIMDNKFPSFGMCSSLANPAVVAATAAALGVLTPQPCAPVIAGPWAAGSPTVLIGGKPALNNTSKLACAYGMIQITSPMAVTMMIP